MIAELHTIATGAIANGEATRALLRGHSRKRSSPSVRERVIANI
jgi:hypothetical protein